MSTPIRLPLSQRQAGAVAKALAYLAGSGPASPEEMLSVDESAALREVAEKLETLREK